MKDHYSLLECMSSFFSYNVYLRDKSRSSLAQQDEFLSRNPDKQFFLKMAERWGINVYIVAIKDHYSPLECMSSFFLVIICICVTNHVLFLLTGTIFCKKCWHKQFFLKTVELWDININVVWKTTIVALSVCRAFLVITCICVTSHVLLWLNRMKFFQEILT